MRNCGWFKEMAFHNCRSTWFLAQLKPNCAKIADKNLKRQGFQTFLPLEEETRPRKGRFVTTLQPLFPGYIFVSFDEGLEPWRKINSTYGITRLVSFGNEPTPLPCGLISQLMLRCDAKGKLLLPDHLQPGDQVMLIKGPFASFVAEVEKITPDQRIWILLEIMGGQCRVAVTADQLKAVREQGPLYLGMTDPAPRGQLILRP